MTILPRYTFKKKVIDCDERLCVNPLPFVLAFTYVFGILALVVFIVVGIRCAILFQTFKETPEK